MATYEITSPDGQTYEVTAPDNASETAVLAYAKSQFDKTTKPSVPTLTQEQIAAHSRNAAKSSVRAEHPYLSKAADLLGGASSTMRGALNLVSPAAAEYMFPMSGVDKESGAYLAGQILDPAAMAIGAGGMKAAQLSGTLPRIGSTIASHPVLSGMIGGALGGAGVGAIGEDSSAVSGGMFGGAVGGALPVAAKIGGSIIDRISGITPALKAKKAIQDVAGDRLAKIRALWRQSPSDISASQAAEPAGSTTLAALGERAAKGQSQYYDDLFRDQQAARQSVIAKLAGGQTQAESRSAAERAKESLNLVTTPMRETELGAANIAGDVTRKLQPLIRGKQEGMVKALQDSGRVFSDENSARLALLNKIQSKTPGWVKPETIRILEDNVVKQRSAVQDVNAMKWQRQDERDFLQRQLDSISDYGLRPIDTNSILTRIERKLSDPKLAGNSIAENSMINVANEIATWTAKNGGIIDAQALYSIRKNAVNSAIQKQLSGASPKAQNKAASGVLKAIQPMIDDAIESAGGTGWKNYLQTYADGMNIVNQQKLGGKALNLLEKSPKGFIDLVRNNRPDVVRKIFESEDDIVKAMGSGYNQLNKVASELERDINLAMRAKSGREELAGILASDASKLYLPALIDWRIAAAKRAGDVMEASLNKKTMDKVYAAMRSGKSAEELMNMLPARDRIPFLNVIYSGKVTPATIGAQQANQPKDQQ